jgi:cytoskeletal protein RodZ
MMRITKISLMLCLIATMFLMAACQKDSVTPQAKTPPSTQEKVTHNKKTEQEKKSVEAEQPETASQDQQESPAKTTEATTENKTAAQTTKPTTTTNTPATAPKTVETMVNVQVSGYQGKMILPVTKVPIKQGDTVLSATKSILKSKGIPISVKGSGATAYVEGIGNEFEFDHGPTSGWLVYLNGKEISRSAGTVSIKKDDQILWKYSTELSGAGG